MGVQGTGEWGGVNFSVKNAFPSEFPTHGSPPAAASNWQQKKKDGNLTGTEIWHNVWHPLKPPVLYPSPEEPYHHPRREGNKDFAVHGAKPKVLWLVWRDSNVYFLRAFLFDPPPLFNPIFRPYASSPWLASLRLPGAASLCSTQRTCWVNGTNMDITAFFFFFTFSEMHIKFQKKQKQDSRIKKQKMKKIETPPN